MNSVYLLNKILIAASLSSMLNYKIYSLHDADCPISNQNLHISIASLKLSTQVSAAPNLNRTWHTYHGHYKIELRLTHGLPPSHTSPQRKKKQEKKQLVACPRRLLVWLFRVMSSPSLAPAVGIKDRCGEIKSSAVLVPSLWLFFVCFLFIFISQWLVPYTKWHLSFNAERSGLYIPGVCECEYTTKHEFLIMRLLACPIYGNHFGPRGWKTQDAGKKGSKSWRKINTALWNKKCRLFTFHWSDDAGETPQTGIKLREYIFCVFSPQGQERAKKKLEQTETNHSSKIKLLIHITNPHGNIIKYQAE